jgi:hypothetical protein
MRRNQPLKVMEGVSVVVEGGVKSPRIQAKAPIIQKPRFEAVPVDLIYPNDHNPNRMRPAMYKALRQSILRFGFLVPIVVRQVGDRYVIVDGEHRWRAAKDLGMERVPAMIAEISEEEAKWASLHLNRPRGKNEGQKLFPLLIELQEKPGGGKRLRKELAYGAKDLRNQTTVCDCETIPYVPGEKRPLELEHGKKFEETKVSFIVFNNIWGDHKLCKEVLSSVHKDESKALKEVCTFYAKANGGKNPSIFRRCWKTVKGWTTKMAGLIRNAGIGGWIEKAGKMCWSQGF